MRIVSPSSEEHRIARVIASTAPCVIRISCRRIRIINALYVISILCQVPFIFSLCSLCLRSAIDTRVIKDRLRIIMTLKNTIRVIVVCSVIRVIRPIWIAF